LSLVEMGYAIQEGKRLVGDENGGILMYKEDNEKVRAAVLGAVNGVSDDILNTKPSPEEWSPMQILDHLQLMESVVARNVQKQLTKSESEKARKKPIQLTVSRLIKVDAP